jgi:gas vesicle protein
MEDESTGTNFIWFLTGAALGAAIALLLAPQEGRETRDQVRRRVLEGRETLTKTGKEAYEKGRELYERGKELADDASELEGRLEVFEGPGKARIAAMPSGLPAAPRYR